MQDTKELTTEEKARIMRNQYAREWRRKNPDKVKATMEKHYAKMYDQLVNEKVQDDGEQESI